jgi:hypothetical protein
MNQKVRKNLIIVLASGLICFVITSYFNNLLDILVFQRYFLDEHHNGMGLVFIDDSDVYISKGYIRLSHNNMSLEDYNEIKNGWIKYLTYQSLKITCAAMIFVILLLSLFQIRKSYSNKSIE